MPRSTAFIWVRDRLPQGWWSFQIRRMVTALMASSPDRPIEDLERSAAWKYVGYPGFCNLMASSNDCFAIRRFGALNVRVLLKLQNEIIINERALLAIDESSKGPLKHGERGCGSLRLDEDSDRAKLLDQTAVLLKDYNERLVQFLQLQDRPLASPDQLHNLRSWHAYYPNAVETSEQEFLENDKDLICPRLAHRTHFGRWMQSLGLLRLAAVKRDGATKYYNWNTWKSISGIWLLFCASLLLLGPLWAMPFAQSTVLRLSIVTGATVSVSLLAVFGTTLKPSQRSLFVAGYFGLLILMLGLIPVWNAHLGAVDTAANVQTLFPTTRTISVPVTTTGTIQASRSRVTATEVVTTTLRTDASRNVTLLYDSISRVYSSGLSLLRAEAATATGPVRSALISEISDVVKAQHTLNSLWSSTSVKAAQLSTFVSTIIVPAPITGTITHMEASSRTSPGQIEPLGQNNIAVGVVLGAAVGVAIPIVVVVLAIIFFIFLRRIKKRITISERSETARSERQQRGKAALDKGVSA